ncbi:MAG: methanogenesis marker 17 protein [Methanobrevibacter millerae]|uniref:Methanogenesis marker 17 protein n=1 Tax=Methanobrevibacter millerae TaxID=230361 RepID=A0A8T3VIF6_9EURY|nr:methanogenesis marker 17 protein [Methanobrevibacter millerae]MBE6505083.1 methanogenesis marker 17 protein [Methanobrevibacter millerae]
MLVECYDKKGAEVYEIIIKQIFQDLVLGASVDDLKAFVNPDDPVFIIAIKMKKTSTVVKFNDVANFTYDKAEDVTHIFVEDENYLPNILKRLWRRFSRDEIYQPTRYNIDLDGNQMDLETLVIDDPHSNLQRRIYDAIFRILPEGFKIIKDMSTKDVIAVVATDELIMDAWVEKAEEYIAELENGM